MSSRNSKVLSMQYKREMGGLTSMKDEIMKKSSFITNDQIECFMRFLLTSFTGHAPTRDTLEGKPLSIGGLYNYIAMYNDVNKNGKTEEFTAGSRCFSTRFTFENLFTTKNQKKLDIGTITEQKKNIENIILNSKSPTVITCSIKAFSNQYPTSTIPWVGHTFNYILIPHEVNKTCKELKDCRWTIFKCQSYIYTYDLRVKEVSGNYEMVFKDLLILLGKEFNNEQYVELFGHKPVLGPNLISSYGFDSVKNIPYPHNGNISSYTYTTEISEQIKFKSTFLLYKMDDINTIYEKISEQLNFVLKNLWGFYNFATKYQDNLNSIFIREKQYFKNEENMKFLIESSFVILMKIVQIGLASCVGNFKLDLYQSLNFDINSVFLWLLSCSDIKQTLFNTPTSIKNIQTIIVLSKFFNPDIIKTISGIIIIKGLKDECKEYNYIISQDGWIYDMRNKDYTFVINTDGVSYYKNNNTMLPSMVFKPIQIMCIKELFWNFKGENITKDSSLNQIYQILVNYTKFVKSYMKISPSINRGRDYGL